MPEIIDPVFVKTSQNARFLLSENERFGLVFVKTGSINSGTRLFSVQSQVRYTQISPNHRKDKYKELGMFPVTTRIYEMSLRGTVKNIGKSW